MTDQKQDVSQGALAVQSGRDTTIHQGLSASDLRQILDTLAAQFPAQVAAAREIVESRLADFEKRILDKFSIGEIGNSQAFADPDFQYVVRTSQHAYARCGDEGVRDVLIDLIARRSQQIARGRLSLTLNEAVERSAVLTKNEFAELSLCYLLKYTCNYGVGNMEKFVNYFRTHIAPLLPDISTEHASYQYIEAQSCGTLGVVSTDLANILTENYGGVFSKGFAKNAPVQLWGKEQTEALEKNQLIIPCLNDEEMFQLRGLNRKHFLDVGRVSGIENKQLEEIWSKFSGTFWSGEELLSNIEKHLPEIRDLQMAWNDTAIKQLNLTTVGIAIGHSNLVRLTGLNAELSTWVK